MFSNLFFLILNLFLISTAIDQQTPPFLSDQPGLAFTLFFMSYLFFLCLICLQCLWLKHAFSKERILFFINIEILLFFSCFYFFLGAERWLLCIFSPFGVTFLSLFSLILYFTSLFICQFFLEPFKTETSYHKSWLSICFLIPFTLPFLILTFFNEASQFFPLKKFFNTWGVTTGSYQELLLFIFLNVAVILTTLILLPPLAIFVWHCPELKDISLKKELDSLCERANFKHAGFRIWNIMNSSATAAIMGIAKKLRYILFTQKLLNIVPHRSIVAILAHEIGHSAHRHLFFYPFILLGMVVIASLTSLLIYLPILQKISIQEHYPYLVPFLMFCLFGLTIACYFRFIFGYFSRIFERQADLYIFKLNICAADLIESLNILGISAGYIHHEPNWHHYGIQERIDFINRADRDRSLIVKHARLVRNSLLVYFTLLTISVMILWNLI